MMTRKRTTTVAITLLLAAGSGVALAADGAAVYKAQCAKCHGETGQADSPAAKAMKVPAIAGDAKIAGLSDADLVAKIKENKKHVTLKSLSDADLAAAAAYAKQLAAGK
jgi:cytochrome c